MMSNLTTYIILFSLVSGFNPLELSNDEPKFELEYHDWVTCWIGDLTENKLKNMTDSQKYPMKLSTEERIALCNAAKEFVGVALDMPSEIVEVPLRSYYVYRLVMQCDTLPVAFLEVDINKPADNKWRIAINTNDMAKKYNFEVEKRFTEPIPRATTTPEFDDSGASFVINIHIFSSFTATDRLFLCLAAKQEIIRGQEIPVHRVPVMLSKEVEPPQAYNFENTERVALKCPCAPPMYIYFKDPPLDEKEVMKVVLVTDDSEPKPEPEPMITTPS